MAAVVLYLLSYGHFWYAQAQLETLTSDRPSLSVTTRLFSTVGPFMVLPEKPWVLIGVGLGGTSLHLDDLVPAVVVEDIKEVSWENQPGLKTLWGKILGETGLVGTILFGAFTLATLRAALSASRAVSDIGFLSISRAAALALIALIITHAIGFGAYTFPYLWFWAGLADGIGLIGKQQLQCPRVLEIYDSCRI
jgi:O-antigen ligase